MRIINTEEIIPIIGKLAIQACCCLSDNVIDAFKKALETEESPIGKDSLEIIIENSEFARDNMMPCCHDTGMAVVVMEIGQEVSWKGKPLYDQVEEGIRRGYENGHLRKSVVADPLERINTNDNTPVVFHPSIVPGDKVKITVMPKGGGSENMGAFKVLLPGAGEEGIKEFVLETVARAGGNPCPPYIVGIGVGDTMDQCAWMAKKALLRDIGERNPNPRYAKLEEDLLEAINNTGIGPIGYGGRSTALDVHVDYYGVHITALPVAINFQCNAARQATAVL